MSQLLLVWNTDILCKVCLFLRTGSTFII